VVRNDYIQNCLIFHLRERIMVRVPDKGLFSLMNCHKVDVRIPSRKLNPASLLCDLRS
jgi:hypothetical protein